jgi:hypothetical protein
MNPPENGWDDVDCDTTQTKATGGAFENGNLHHHHHHHHHHKIKD